MEFPYHLPPGATFTLKIGDGMDTRKFMAPMTTRSRTIANWHDMIDLFEYDLQLLMYLAAEGVELNDTPTMVNQRA